ncbi:hypothetical protein [Spiroplasma endosymbiont of Seladonia tumulorum]|uniref:hypothetical protein n=1 Tax=Spiroplasma endosymbiont of Seladonia tumulorum TaxID=3066321 RepID=UPI0030D284E1
MHDDEGIYYNWILFRNGKDFPAEWVEMTSPDMNSWTQTEIRIKRGREFSQTSYIPSALGGSVWRDDEGDIVFVISMQPCKLMDGSEITRDSGIAYFVLHGLGQPIYKTGVLAPEKPAGINDWRDTFIYQTDDGLHFAISTGNRVEFWKINSFETNDIEKVDELYVRGFGVEVPKVIRFGENKWYISCSVQDAPDPTKGPFQSSYWYLCKLVDGKFEVYSQGQHEYGPEGYAQRVSDPYQTKITKKAYVRAMLGNWNYNTDIWAWKGGCYGTDELSLSEYWVGLTPNDLFTDYYDNGTAVYILKGKNLIKGYKLSFNKGDITFYLEADKFFGIIKLILDWKSEQNKEDKQM